MQIQKPRDREQPDTPGRRMLTGGLQMLFANALFPLTGLITAGFLTRVLTTAEYGLFTLTATLIGWVQFIMLSLFSRGTIKLIGDAEDWRPTATMILRTRLTFSLLMLAAVWALAEPLAKLLDAPELTGYLRLLAIDLPIFSLAASHRQILVGQGNYRQDALATASRWIVRFLLILILVGLGMSIRGAILALIGASIAELIIGRIYVRPSLWARHQVSRRPLWDYALPLFLAALALRLIKLDLFMIKALGGSLENAGHYGAAQNLAMPLSLVGMAVSPVLLSTLTRLLRDSEPEKARELARGALRFGWLILPFGGLMAGASTGIVRVVFGPGYETAGPIFFRLIFGAFALMLVSITSSIPIAAGRPGWTLWAAAPLVPLAIAGHLIMIPRMGMIGAANVTAVCSALSALASFMVVYRLWKITPPWPSVLRSVLLATAALILAGSGPMLGVLLIAKLAGIVLLIVAGYLLLGELDRSEIQLIGSLLRRKPQAGS